MKRLFEKKIKTLYENSVSTIQAGRFQVMLPEVFGFCDGVISALKKLENIISINVDKNIYLLGEIIHNPTVNQYFVSSGVNIIPESNLDNIFNLAEGDDYIVIPAFGIPLNLENRIRRRYKNIIDTTCRNVKSVWEFISSEAKKNSTIILYGKPGHPEVKASISRTENNSCIIVLPDLEAVEYFTSCLNNCDLSSIKQSIESTCVNKDSRCYNSQSFNPKRFALANQTTMLYNETIEIEKIIRNTVEKKHSELIACDTICRATYLRQKAAQEVCRKNPDLIFVVGGYESSNTLHLYRLAQKYSSVYYLKGVESIGDSNVTFFIPEQSKEITISTKQLMKNISKIGIFAGASCPFAVINKIIEKLGVL